MRLIDADALKDYLEDLRSYTALCEERDFYRGETNALDVAVGVVDKAPTIDAVPVKHGRWIDNKESIIGELIERNCSLCGQRTTGLYNHFFPYCPNCGAKMDAKEEV